MRRVVFCCSTLALLFVSASVASSQTRARGILAGGPSMASGDLETVDSLKNGFAVMFGGDIGLGSSAFAVRFDGMFSKHDKQGEFSESRELFGANVRLIYTLMAGSSVRPYLLTGVGVLAWKHNYARNNTQKPGSTSGQLVIGSGAGVDITVGRTTLFVEGRYDMGTEDITTLPILIGIKFPSW